MLAIGAPPWVAASMLGLLFMAMPACLLAKEAPEKACILLENRRFNVEVARTPEAQQRGLQFRTSLPAAGGMMFPYDDAVPRAFWMKDCRIPLDILFYRAGKLVDYVDNAPPCRLPAHECPVYTSAEPSDLVVELKAGTRRRYGFKRQSRVSFCPSAVKQSP